MLGVGSFFREGVLVDRSGIEDRRLGLIGTRKRVVGFLWPGLVGRVRMGD